MTESKKAVLTPLLFIAGWCIFTITLVIWWVTFTSRLINSILEHNLVLSPESVAAELLMTDLLDKKSMLIWEGMAFVLLLLAGAAALVYYFWREEKHNRQIKEFFTYFSHELKTPIASLRLQAESLQEDLQDTDHAPLLVRLIKDTERLELRLENSQYLANIDTLSRLHLESIDLSKVLDSVAGSYPEIEIHFYNDCKVFVDSMALEAIIKNIASNAIIHGAATQLDVVTTKLSDSQVEITLSDNGSGFSGNSQRLGELFFRHSTQSGSGIGLFLVKSLTKKLGGMANFDISHDGRFYIQLILRCK